MKYGFGIDIGGTTVKLAFFSAQGEKLASWEIPTNKENGGANILPDIAASALGYLEENNIPKSDVLGLGVGVPGPVDEKGVVNGCVNLGWGVTDMEATLGALTGLKVKAGNDANVAALGECWKGGGAGCDDMIMVTLGTGVGGGTILGLSRKMLGIGSIEHLEQISEGGDLGQVDLRIKDISKSGTFKGVNENLTASNFGNLSDLASKKDIALGIFNMVSETVAMMSIFAARQFGIKDIVMCGNLTSIKPVCDTFASLAPTFGVNFIVPEMSQYGTVIGAALQ